MFNSASPSLADIAAVTGNNRNNDGFADGNGWWVLIILFALFGGWGNGYGGFGGNGGGMAMATMQPWATQADVRAAVDQQTLISKLDQQTYGLADSTYALNNTINSNFRTMDNAVCNLGFNVQQGFNDANMAMMQNTNAIQSTLNNMAAQNASCCCETQRQIERGFADTNYNMATQACETRRAIADSTRNILDFLTQDKIATLTAENQSLKFAASQTAQNQFITQVGSDIVNRLQPVPVPAFPASNLYAYGNGSGCGCNSCC